ncbi:MAG: hypothetical protein MUC49_05485 [Raineya sp.]|jgi:uncharacterized membrane protein|nr:hypothetical protein [Raineya sp.]
MIPKNFFSTLRILHLAISFGTLAIIIIFYVLSKSQPEAILTQDNQMLVYIFPVFAVVVGAMGIFLSKQFLTKIKDQNLLGKLNQYRAAYIVRWAMIEGGSIMLVMAFFMSKQIVFLALACGGLAFLLLQKADIDTFRSEVQLSSEEKKELENTFR